MSHYLQKGRIIYKRQLAGLEEFMLSKKQVKWQLPLPGKYLYKLKQKKIHLVEYVREQCQISDPVVSVITVVKNDIPGLSKTLNSVFSQTSRNFEYIVMDGCSDDGTDRFAKKYLSSIDQFHSSKDNGPYDAMYKSLAHAKGKFVLFLNAGDEFASCSSLQDALELAPIDSVDIIYGHHYFATRRNLHESRRAKDLNMTYRALLSGDVSEAWRNGIPCHQATMIRRELLLEYGFDPAYKIAADHDLLLKACSKGCKSYHTNTYISRYYAGGYSSKMKPICNQDWRDIAMKYTQHPEKVARLYDV